MIDPAMKSTAILVASNLMIDLPDQLSHLRSEIQDYLSDCLCKVLVNLSQESQYGINGPIHGDYQHYNDYQSFIKVELQMPVRPVYLLSNDVPGSKVPEKSVPCQKELNRFSGLDIE